MVPFSPGNFCGTKTPHSHIILKMRAIRDRSGCGNTSRLRHEQRRTWCTKVLLLLLRRKPCSPSITAASVLVGKRLLSALNRGGMSTRGDVMGVTLLRFSDFKPHMTCLCWHCKKKMCVTWGGNKQNSFGFALYHRPWSTPTLKRPRPETPNVPIIWSAYFWRGCFGYTKAVSFFLLLLLMVVPPPPCPQPEMTHCYWERCPPSASITVE